MQDGLPLTTINGQGTLSTTLVITGSGVVPMTAQEAYEAVTTEAGAYPRDAVDERIVNDVLNETGGAIGSQSEVGGWPFLQTGTAPIDSNNDGIPDEWERVRGGSMNPHDVIVEPYTNIEHYINEPLDGVTFEETTDTEPPVIQVVLPRPNAPVSRTVLIAGSVSDNTSVQRIDVAIDGIRVHTIANPAPNWSWTWTVTGRGKRVITAVAFDTSGNSSSASRTVRVIAVPQED
jgi:hypothetical protein